MEHNWEKYFDTTSEYWEKLQALYAANEHYPKKVVKGRNLHHKFLRSFSKKDKEHQDDDDENLVSLSEGDHFLAHFYIWKLANKGYRASAALAVRMMYRKSLKYITAEIAEDIAKVWQSKEYIPTDETRRKLSDANKGHKVSEEAKRKISDANKGKPSNYKGKHRSEETKRKLSEAIKGHTVSEETKRKIAAAMKGKPSNHKGKQLSEETKRKIAETLKGQPSPNKGKHLSDEQRRKISDAKKGKHCSEETKRKIAEAMAGKRAGKHWKIVDGKRIWY